MIGELDGGTLTQYRKEKEKKEWMKEKTEEDGGKGERR
jgi:hypothetical protein